MIYNYPVKKKKTESGETWYFNDVIYIQNTYTCKFKSNNTAFDSIGFKGGFTNSLLYGATTVATGVGIFEDLGLIINEWTNSAYRTVTFSEPPTGDLLTWLQKNAVKQ